MPSYKTTYDLPPGVTSHVVKEEHVEYGFIGMFQNLKYEYRADIRDRAALEHTFRQKFEALNRVHLSDGEFGVDDAELYARALNLLSHGKHDIYQPAKMVENVQLFRQILDAFLGRCGFALPDIFERAASRPIRVAAPRTTLIHYTRA